MIKINDDYFIDVDVNEYTAKIDRHRNDKNGNPIADVVGHYSTLQNAIAGIKNDFMRKGMQDKDYNLKEAIDRINELEKTFSEWLERQIG